MNKTFLLKFVVSLWTWIKLTAILFPFTYLAVSIKQGTLKYGYDFFEIDYRWALMISIGIALMFVSWTALEFGRLNFQDPLQYLKSRQKHYYHFKSSHTSEEINELLSSYAVSKRRHKLLNTKDGWQLHVRNPWLITDTMKIKIQEGALFMESYPKGWAWMVDMGRNFRHILDLGNYLRDREV